MAHELMEPGAAQVLPTNTPPHGVKLSQDDGAPAAVMPYQRWVLWGAVACAVGLALLPPHVLFIFTVGPIAIYLFAQITFRAQLRFGAAELTVRRVWFGLFPRTTTVAWKDIARVSIWEGEVTLALHDGRNVTLASGSTEEATRWLAAEVDKRIAEVGSAALLTKF